MSPNAQKPKIIVILGPTASGKSDLAVKLAKKINGEIISADSRQVYRGMDIGTGKILKKEMAGISHHLLSIASPKKQFSVSQYQKLANQAIKRILKKGKTPIICGGTGLYIDAAIDNVIFPDVPPNRQLRKKLEKLTVADLFEKLKKVDPRRARSIDRNNPRRLIRALEIVLVSKRPVPKIKKQRNYDVLKIGVRRQPKKLKELIKKRLLKRIETGMIEEIKKLHEQGVSWKRLFDFGLEYRWVSLYLQKKIPQAKMIEELTKAINDYAKRQMTWFKRDKEILWVNDYKQALKITKTRGY
ncbi:MAG TPA: tRNA (adenosine(37)-N6)-dimethylallyltransferase MiaA [Candidatus Paceibacterota bacterium]|nr:tRNA (adenosine(37)-N6)-dimethylallyltransferase MiaA [Candidatus Paceibacterota bacterium]HRY76548.1 tRNA (adenosine(37)-N6)-dimethylallyltransferase MiaA [Candidatus Paceibacterota bacterium]